MSCVAVIFHTQQQQHRDNEYLAMVMYYTFTYKQRKILADFTRYFNTGFFVCDKYAPLQTCVTCWFVCFVLFVAEFRHQMLNPRQVNNPAGGRREKKVQDHQLLQTRASHAEQWRRVCFLFFFPPCVLWCFTQAEELLWCCNFSKLIFGRWFFCFLLHKIPSYLV